MKWFVIVLLEQEGKPSLTINRRVPERNMLESLLLVMINLRIIKNSMATHILYYRLRSARRRMKKLSEKDEIPVSIMTTTR